MTEKLYHSAKSDNMLESEQTETLKYEIMI